MFRRGTKCASGIVLLGATLLGFEDEASAGDACGDPLLVIVAPRVQTRSLEVTLGDIARLGGKNPVYRELAASLSLGYAPVAGTARTFSRADLEARLVDAGLPSQAFVLTGSAACIVEGVAATLKKERFEAEATRFVEQRLTSHGNAGKTCRVVRGAQDAAIPGEANDLLFRCEFVGRPVVEGTARILVRVEHDGLTLVRQVVDVVIEATTTPPAQGDGLQQHVPARVGTTARRTERPERVIQRGDLVEVESQVGNVRVTTRGRAREHGSLGEVITIELLDPQTGRRRSELSGRVEAAGRVRVLTGGTGR